MTHPGNRRNTPQHQWGFTLIETLVVIAIIGLLATIIIVSLWFIWARAPLAKVKEDMHQLRNQAALISDVNYDNVTLSDPEIDRLNADVQKNGGSAISIQYSPLPPESQAYCATTVVPPSTVYCVDSTGAFKEGSTVTCSPTAECVSL